MRKREKKGVRESAMLCMRQSGVLATPMCLTLFLCPFPFLLFIS